MPPSNDDFANRIALDPAPDSATGFSTFDATLESGEPVE